MPGRHLTVAYTGRPELHSCWLKLAEYPVRIILAPCFHPVDLIISAAGTHLFTPEEINQAQYGIVNLHLAPLPEYRGRYSGTHAILNGEREFGVTLHYVDEGIDTGPIIAKSMFPILPDDTAGSLRLRAHYEGEWLFQNVLPGLLCAACEGCRLPATPQDESKARYYDRHSLPVPNLADPLMVRALTC